MNGIFKNFSIKNLELKNRIVMAPMCMNMAKSGYANKWHETHYETRAIGGVGLIILEATSVSPEGRITKDDLGIWSDEHISGLKNIVDKVHKAGGKIGIQLAHAGRKAVLNNEKLYAPSAIAFNKDYQTPDELTILEIDRITNDFILGAKRAYAAGFDMIEIHGAHGYLINQFISPLSNKRNDAYGGNLIKRTKFLNDLLIGIKKVWPNEKPIFLRISGEEYNLKGNTQEELAQIVNQIKNIGIDVVDVSSGGVVPSTINTFPGYQLAIGSKIKKLTSLPVIVGGLITELSMANEIIENQRGDLIYLGRELLRNPYWVLQASRDLDIKSLWPKAYERSK